MLLKSYLLTFLLLLILLLVLLDGLNYDNKQKLNNNNADTTRIVKLLEVIKIVDITNNLTDYNTDFIYENYGELFFLTSIYYDNDIKVIDNENKQILFMIGLPQLRSLLLILNSNNFKRIIIFTVKTAISDYFINDIRPPSKWS